MQELREFRFMIDFKNKKIAVVGEGLEGKSNADYLRKQGAKVTILDQNQGENYLNDLNSFDLVVRSPGVHISKLKGAPKVKITSQIKLFMELCPCPVIGVTGTKGKGTTSSLIYEMLKKDGRDVYLGGNIGTPPFEFLDKLNESGKDIFPVTIVFMNEFDVEGKKQVYPIVLNHINNDEVKNKVLHIESPNSELLELFIRIIEKRKK